MYRYWLLYLFDTFPSRKGSHNISFIYLSTETVHQPSFISFIIMNFFRHSLIGDGRLFGDDRWLRCRLLCQDLPGDGKGNKWPPGNYVMRYYIEFSRRGAFRVNTLVSAGPTSQTKDAPCLSRDPLLAIRFVWKCICLLFFFLYE